MPFEAKVDVSSDGKSVVDVTLVREATQGHLAVRTDGEPLRVVIDGVDVGATPWEGDVAPGLHEVGGRSSTALAAPQSVTVAVGARADVQLSPVATAAHLQVRTNDGQGLITVDGAPKGTGAFAGEVAPGPHTITVTRDGYKPFQKSLTLGPRETSADTVTLEPIPALPATTARGQRSEGEGVYGGLGFAWLPGINGMGSELETGCSTLGAVSCSTPSPTASGSLFGYVGWTWNPVGFELLLAAQADTVTQKATFDGKGGNSGTLTTTSPARVETFTFGRLGGQAALRVRASYTSSVVRATIAAGPGVSVKYMLMKRDISATDGSGLQGIYVPDPVSYVSPGLSIEGALHFRLGSTFALALGAEMWAENASTGTAPASPPSPGHSLYSAQPGVLPVPIPTPQYHYATGPQVFLGPFLGMQFGP
jgi:hypothetical protein